MFNVKGDCIEALDYLIQNKIKVDLTITSPPYFNLRNYSEDQREIGQEKNPNDYINVLINLFNKIYLITNETGSCYVNIGDKYHNGSLLCLPDKFKLEMIKNGWLCKNEIIWHKPNAIPSSAKNRFTNDFEKIFFFVKNKKYIFNTQYEKRKSTVTKKQNNNGISKYLSDEQEKSVRQGMSKTRGSKIIEKRYLLPKQEIFVNYLRSKTNIKKLSDDSGLSKTKIEHWFRKDNVGFSYPSVKDWLKVKDYINDWSDEFFEIDKGIMSVTYENDDINKNSSLGRIKRTTWTIPTKPSKFKHFAPYPEALIEAPILASTNENDVILDPFMGSGTTGLVAKKHNRQFIGIELESKYFSIAEERLNNV